MKKLLIIAIVFTFLSCGTKKIIEQKTTVEKELKKDSTFVSITSTEIKDSLRVKVSSSETGNKNIDSIVNAEIDKILSKIDTNKSSGTNELSFSYDKLAKVLIAYGKVAESKNQKTKTNIFEKNHSTKVVEVPVKYIPKLVKYLAILGLFSLLLLVVIIIRWSIKKYKEINPFL